MDERNVQGTMNKAEALRRTTMSKSTTPLIINGYTIEPYANLQGANLQGADLQGANLRGANLQGADLWGADLRGANLRGANLQGADLRGANLWGADLQGADLWGADLRGADLRGANLQGADLRGANLWGADLQGGDLWGANLRGATMGGGTEPIDPKIFGVTPDATLPKRVAQAILKSDDALDMGGWHTCDTTHCLAGWAIHLSGSAGYALEQATSPSVAGCMLMPSVSHLFYATNEQAREWAQQQLQGAQT